MTSIALISLIIIGAGLVGGVANYHRFETNQLYSGFALRKSLLVGLVAAATIPLFLRMLSSDLLSQAATDPINYFVFAGFCLIAAFYSSRFLQTIGDQVLRELEEVKRKTEIVAAETAENTAKVDVVVDDLTDKADAPEKDTAGERNIGTRGLEDIPDEYANPQDRILSALANDKYSFRTLAGIAKECQMEKGETAALIEALRAGGLVIEVRNRRGHPIYALSEEGKEKMFSR